MEKEEIEYPSKLDILDWIAEHDTLAEDFERHFGVSVEQTVEAKKLERTDIRFFDEQVRAYLDCCGVENPKESAVANIVTNLHYDEDVWNAIDESVRYYASKEGLTE